VEPDVGKTAERRVCGSAGAQQKRTVTGKYRLGL
jgi:hypothetical protein